MTTSLRVLILEDRVDDAELMVYELRRAGFDPDWQRVDTKADFCACLDSSLDIILSDYSLPQWDALGALQILQESGLDVPFIMISGAVGEELAVECIKQGAVDYLLKDRLGRLGPAVSRALEDKRRRVEQKQIQEQLRRSEAMLREAQRVAHVGSWVWNIKTNQLECSDEVYRIFGIDKEHFSGSLEDVIAQAIHPEDRAKVEQSNLSVINEKKPIPIEYRVVRPDHSIGVVWAEAGELIVDEAGNPAILTGIVQDITERKQAEQALRESEEKYRLLAETTRDIILLHDMDGRIVYINQAGLDLTGYQQETIIGQPVDVFIPPEHQKALVSRGTQRGDGAHDTYRYETEFVSQEGKSIPLEVNSTPVLHDGQVSRILIVARDITERKQAEEELAKERNLLRTLIDNLPDLVYVKDTESRFVLANPATVRSLGVTSPDEVIGKTDYDFHPQQLAERFYTDEQALLESLQLQVGQEQLVTDPTSGQARWLLTTKVPLQDRDGNVLGLIGIGHDITERKAASKALQNSEEKYRQIVETAHEGILIVDTNNSITFVNARLAEMFGYEVGAILGRSLFDFLDADNRSIVEAQIERRKRGFSGQYEAAFQHHDGTPLQVFVSANPLVDQQGHYRGSQAMVTDITELKRAQEAEREQRVLAEGLAQTARALISALDLDDVMHTILENIAPVVPHDAANIMLLEGDQARAVYWHGYGLEHSRLLQEFCVPLSDTPNLQHMFVTGTSFLASYTAQYDGWVREPVTEWVKSYVAVPIRSHGAVIGFLNLDSGTPGYFNEEHARRLQVFADQTSLAIEHAQLYEQIQQHAGDLERRVKERTTELNQAKERTEAILNSSNDIIILCRKNGTISQVNRTFTTTFQDPDAVLNQPLTNLVIPEHTRVLDEAFETVVRTQQPQRIEVVAQARSHDLFDVDVMLSPVVGPENELLGVVGGLRDITQHKQLEAQLRQLLEHEMELNELKSRYVGMAAHDLRNPLAVIKSAVDIIQRYRDRLTEERLESKLDSIQLHIQTMVAMLDDILMLEKVAAGKLSFEPAPIDLADFCRRIGKEVEVGTETSERIVVTYQGGCGRAVVDEKLLRHMLGNLLSNAIKYSSEDSIVTFTVDCQPEQLVFRIQDQGIGIPKADQERLFQAFHRASNTGHVPGTGLGLSIVKQAVELHGGTITFESEEGHGSTFIVTLPVIENEKL